MAKKKQKRVIVPHMVWCGSVHHRQQFQRCEELHVAFRGEGELYAMKSSKKRHNVLELHTKAS